MKAELKTAVVLVASVTLGAWLAGPTAASAKGKGRSCAAAEARFQATGAGDSDGDGLTDCREKQLGTSIHDADSDQDGVSDAAEITQGSDPNDADSDHDGVDDADDDTPGIPEQEVKGFLDALTCPQPGVPGSISVLGIDVALDDQTQFEDTTCDALLALLQSQTPPSTVEVEIKILEDVNGALTAREVGVEQEQDQQGGDQQG